MKKPTAKPTKEDLRGKHREGVRAYPKLYERIMKVLNDDHDAGGLGLVAYKISQKLQVNNVTCMKYLNDLATKEKIECVKILDRTVYRIHEKPL